MDNIILPYLCICIGVCKCLLAKREFGFGSVAVRCVAIAMRRDCDALRCDATLHVRVKTGQMSVAGVFIGFCRGGACGMSTRGVVAWSCPP